MIIALDLDGVISDTLPEFQYRLKHDFNLELPDEKWTTFRIEELFPSVGGEWVYEQFGDPTFWLNCKCRPDAWYMVNKWFMEGNDVFIVTCRGGDYGPRTMEMTERWLDEWEINYNRIYHSETSGGKYETCLKIHADIFVEDSAQEVATVSQHIPSYLIDQPYNRDYDIGAGIRIASLYELDEIVEKSKV